MQGYIHKIKNEKAIKLFGKSNKRWFVLDASTKTIKYYPKESSKKFKKEFKLDVSIYELTFEGCESSRGIANGPNQGILTWL
jgi:hypothetical protein